MAILATMMKINTLLGLLLASILAPALATSIRRKLPPGCANAGQKATICGSTAKNAREACCAGLECDPANIGECREATGWPPVPTTPPPTPTTPPPGTTPDPTVADPCYGEPSGGVHVCALEDAHAKCGTKGSDRNDPRYRHVVCCCHSDTCPSACCETSLTDICGGDLDDALEDDGVTIRNRTMYDCMKENIDACNARGNAGTGEQYVDMVAKCARVDDAGGLYCPTGGATDTGLIPEYEICNATSDNACTNPWCSSSDHNSCFDSDFCLCEEQP